MTDVTIKQVEKDKPTGRNHVWQVNCVSGYTEKEYDKLEGAVSYCTKCGYVYEILYLEDQ